MSKIIIDTSSIYSKPLKHFISSKGVSDVSLINSIAEIKDIQNNFDKVLIICHIEQDLQKNLSFKNYSDIFPSIYELSASLKNAEIFFIFSSGKEFMTYENIDNFISKSFSAKKSLNEKKAKSILESSMMNQRSLVKNFRLNILDYETFFTFEEYFANCSHSGISNPNYNLLILEQLDRISQINSSIRDLPYYFRHHSSLYRAFSPTFGFVKDKIKSFRNTVVNKKNNLTNFANKTFKAPFSTSGTINKSYIYPQFDILNKNIKASSIKLALSTKPKLSIIIPVYGKIDYLSKCLYSLQGAKTQIEHEVIVVDDHGPEKVSSRFSKSNGIRLYKTPKNLGFTGACNYGAKYAKGEFLCFLNSDALVTDNWSDNLLNAYKLADNVGIVGPRLIHSNGKLQESGGIVFNNGDAANIGRDADLSDSWFKYFKDVDYVSGAALVIQTKDFKKLKGFDSRFTPAYYEDTSLCLDARYKLKKRVVVNPLSSVIHVEGVTNGKDVSKGIKKYQEINKDKFFKKHKKDLRYHGDSYENLWWDRDKYHKGNILIIDQCIPTPKEDSGSKDMDNIIKTLLSNNLRPHFFALSNRGETPETYSYYEQGVHCIFGDGNRDFRTYYNKYHELYDYILLSRVTSSSEVLDFIKEITPKKKIIFYTVDLHHLRLKQEYGVTKSIKTLRESEKLKSLELKAISDTDFTVLLSEHEEKYLTHECGIDPEKLTCWPLIRKIETKNQFKKSKNPKDIIFIGGFRHTPNIDAVNWLVDEIIPEFSKLFASSKIEQPMIKIYGANAPDAISKLDSKKIKYLGFIEKEEDAFKNAKLSIAPLKFGAGLKGKVLSSLLYKTPVVGTHFAFEGYNLRNKRVYFETSVDGKEFAKTLFDAYLSKDPTSSDWKKIFEDLHDKFSRQSFDKKFNSDILKYNF